MTQEASDNKGIQQAGGRRWPLAAAVAVWALLAQTAYASEPEVVSSRISAVTVFADRAQVTRQASVELRGAEPGRFAFARLPGWIDAESLRVAVEPAGAAQILDVAIQPVFAAEAAEESLRKAQAAFLEVSDQLGEIADEERNLQEEIKRLEALRMLSIDKLPRELAVGETRVKNLAETMSYLSDTIRADQKQLRALGKKRRDLEPIQSQRRAELSELQVRAQLQTSTVVVELRPQTKRPADSGVAQAISIKISYLTPGASWEPSGELRVAQAAAGVQVLQSATVVQTTGEDWTGAALAFSTQRPDDVLDVPEAHGLMLDRGGAGLHDVVGRMTQSFSKAQTVYASQNQQMAKNRKHWDDSLARQNDVQQRALQSFTRLTQRGTTAHFAALAERSVRSDGKPVRVPIAMGEFPYRARIVAVPEVSLNAVRVAEVVNSGQVAILPGPAALFSEGAFIGAGQLEFAAPGESFSVFMGVQDRVKLERVLDKKISGLHRGGRRTEMKLSFVVTAENLGSEPLTLDLSERIPVAQSEDIEVNNVETPRKVKPDSQGLVRWTETLPPKAKLSWRVSYTLDYPSDFVQRRREMPSPRRPEGLGPGAAPKRQMYEQIDMLEKNF
jgi:uncharacterized protein (TIGR02231 family)